MNGPVSCDSDSRGLGLRSQARRRGSAQNSTDQPTWVSRIGELAESRVAVLALRDRIDAGVMQ